MENNRSKLRLTVQGLAVINNIQRQQLAQLTQTTCTSWQISNDSHAVMLLVSELEKTEPLSSLRMSARLEELYPELSAYCFTQQLDCALLPADLTLRDFRLLATDMDSTLITIECIDEIADFCGYKNEVAAITEAAMQNANIDFRDSLRQRVALLQGADARVLERVYQERLQLSPGAQHLLETVRRANIKTLLVSGGFTFFTEKLKQQLGFDFAAANQLEIEHGKLSGHVIGEIVDAQAKAKMLEKTCGILNISPQQAIVMGDGSNDLKMMEIAGLSLAFRAKPIVRAKADIAFNFVGLDGLLRLLST